MRLLRSKIFLLATLAIMILFFSNDFGLFDIEKTAIITGIAVDLNSEDGSYELTAQIAVPQASDTTSENQKTVVSGKGRTVAGAIENIGDVTGWFPRLSFCNIIILGSSMLNTNLIRTVDFFSKTAKVQDSAVLVVAEDSGKELLETASPLDNISAFALQKILLKNPGLESDVATVDIKTFSVDYYGKSGSSFLPLVKKIPVPESGSSGGQGSTGGSQGQSGGATTSSQSKEKNLFDATTTLLFVKGEKVGELNEPLTTAFNIATRKVSHSTLKVDEVEFENEKIDFLLDIIEKSSRMDLIVDEDRATLDIDIRVYSKVLDQNSANKKLNFENTLVIPEEALSKATDKIKNDLLSLVEVSKKTGCDFLGLQKILYRYHNKYYSRYSQNILDYVTTDVNVEIYGQ